MRPLKITFLHTRFTAQQKMGEITRSLLKYYVKLINDFQDDKVWVLTIVVIYMISITIFMCTNTFFINCNNITTIRKTRTIHNGTLHWADGWDLYLESF
jgi:hypothetical protein